MGRSPLMLQISFFFALVIAFYFDFAARQIFFSTDRTLPFRYADAKPSIAFFVIIAILLLVYFHARTSRPAHEVRADARACALRLAERRWYVRGALVPERGFRARCLGSSGWFLVAPFFAAHARLQLAADGVDFEDRYYDIYFPAGHPSIESIGQLSYLDIVCFDFADSSLPGVSETNPCAYLFLRT